MKKADLEKLEAVLMEEVVKRRQLGGYSTEAAGLLLFGEALMRVVQHLIQEYPDGSALATINEADEILTKHRKRK